MAPLSCPPMTQGTAMVTIRLRLPTTLDSLKPEVFEAAIRQDLVLPELDEGFERIIIESLVQELNMKFHVGLDTNFNRSRLVGDDNSEAEHHGDDFIVVGSSHACRTVDSLRAMGEQVTSLADPKWRLTEENVKSLADQLRAAVAANPAATVIIWIYDNSVCYSSTAPGERSLPRR